jgi:acyl transferase domain-containing protein/acyl carrier protein
MNQATASAEQTGLEIAIIGLVCHFPGARNSDQFWHNLREGVESLTFFSDQELLDAGVDPALLQNPNYVKAGAILEDVELFDAAFFGFNPREAEVIDPQHRIFLEHAWAALEHAGYNPETYRGSIGVYAGVGTNTYLFNLYSDRSIVESVGEFQMMLGNNKDFLATRTSYKLNLRGPSYVVQTACSTSLVAVHLASQGLLSGECDMALAGGVAISLPQKAGYLYQEGGVASPDGHCRAFDARSRGTIGGNGVGIVVLKRLTDALEDGDTIHAVIKGSALNNDGASKVGYTAPSIAGQAKVIRAAQVLAEVAPETISYVETHGSATPLGDPIEVRAMTRAFRAGTNKNGFCAIGSVKTNIGHLDAAAGVAGLIKTVLALKHRQIPPSLHFEQPNPEIDFANSPFYVNTKLREWTSDGTPRRAAVNSFGIGGTNAHVILEEAPPVAESGVARPWQVLVLSAKTSTALEAATDQVVSYCRQHPEHKLADIAYTYQIGRQSFSHRRVLVCRDSEDMVHALETRDPKRVMSAVQSVDPHLAFMCAGVGDHYLHMGRGLYEDEPVFRTHVDRCAELLKPYLGVDLRTVLYPGLGATADPASAGHAPGGNGSGIDLRKMVRGNSESTDPATEQLNQTALLQPALFTIEYALAQLWIAWGLRPEALIGYSLGEYVVACLSGVFSLEDALLLVTRRAQLIQALPAGAMLAVPLSEQEVQPLLGQDCSLSAVNGPALCVLAGPTEAIAKVEQQLTARGVACRLLQAAHAFHSTMMEPIVEPFVDLVKTMTLHSPKIPYISNVTGTWITAAEATDPRYWARHLRQTVRFADGVRELWQQSGRVLLEIGPGQTLSSLALQAPDDQGNERRVALPSLRYAYDRQPDRAFVLSTLGQLWLAGITVDWSALHIHARRRLPLPTYPFDRQRYWIEPRGRSSGAPDAQSQQPLLKKTPNPADWFYLPIWKQSMPPVQAADAAQPGQHWLLFVDETGVGPQISERLTRQGQHVIVVTAAERFHKLNQQRYQLNPGSRGDYEALLKELYALNTLPDRIIHAWGLQMPDTQPGPLLFETALTRGFYSLVFLTQALTTQSMSHPLHLSVLSTGLNDVESGDTLYPEQATLLGACRVIPQEYPHIRCRSIDVALHASGSRQEQHILDQLMTELSGQTDDMTVAYRGRHRWVQRFEPIRPPGEPSDRRARLRTEGVYLIVGGRGGTDLLIADYLAQSAQARLALVGYPDLPPRTTWEAWQATHDDQHSVSRTIRAVQRLESRGTDVLIISADIADEEQMRTAIASTCERFGAINGVIYVGESAEDESFRAIPETDMEVSRAHFYPRIDGLYVLARLLREHSCDFCLLMSSLSSILGGLGLSAYSAAYLFMDAFASKQNQDSATPWSSVNWDALQLEDEQTQRGSQSVAATELVIRSDEVGEVLRGLLALGHLPQVVISTGNLQTRIDQWIRHSSSSALGTDAQSDALVLHARPNLNTPYVAPSDQAEESIAEIWQELLGIEQVGIHDNFFQLGGHSLLGTQLISRLREAFQVDLPLRMIFEAPTVAELAVVVEALLIAEINALSEDEALRSA